MPDGLYVGSRERSFPRTNGATWNRSCISMRRVSGSCKPKGNKFKPGGDAMSDLDRTILERHATRMFLPRPVPREAVDEALALAQHAP